MKSFHIFEKNYPRKFLMNSRRGHGKFEKKTRPSMKHEKISYISSV